MKFVKLTDLTDENSVYVKIEDISSIDVDAMSTIIQTPYKKLYVKESPDQIVEKIQSKNEEKLQPNNDENIIKISLDNGFKICAAQGEGKFEDMMCVYIETPDGQMLQNIATLEPYKVILDENLIKSDNYFYLKVWADEESEDFTARFIIHRNPYL